MSTSNTDPRLFGVPLSDAVLLLTLVVAFAYPSWVSGGMNPDDTHMLGRISLVLFGVLVAAPLLQRGSVGQKLQGFVQRLRGILADPICWAGAGVLLVLVVQVINARTGVVTETSPHWSIFPVPYPFLPSSISQSEALVSLSGFALAFAAALSVRHGLHGRPAYRVVFSAFVVNVVLLGLLSLVQLSVSIQDPYFTRLYGGFFYQNHGGAYLYLGLFVAFGLAAYRLCWKERRLRSRTVILAFAVLLFIALTTLLNLSRTAFVVTLFLFPAGVVYVVRKLPGSVSQFTRLKLLLIVAACIGFGVVLFNGRAAEVVREDLFQQRRGLSSVELAYNARSWQWRGAVQMFLDHPLYGVGAQGYAFELPAYTPPEHQYQLGRYFAGTAHSDPLEFLAELGLVGVIPLAIFFYLVLKPLLRKSILRREILLFPFLGCTVLVFHSFFDLPFRSPALFAAWVVLAGVTGKYARELEKVRSRSTKQQHPA